jgi:hypothetical protein
LRKFLFVLITASLCRDTVTLFFAFFVTLNFILEENI